MLIYTTDIEFRAKRIGLLEVQALFQRLRLVTEVFVVNYMELGELKKENRGARLRHMSPKRSLSCPQTHTHPMQPTSECWNLKLTENMEKYSNHALKHNPY